MAMASRTDAAVCMLCEAICGLEVDHDGRRVHAIRGDPNDPLSRGHVCPKGVALADVQNDPERLRRPLLRNGDGWKEIGWDEALGRAATALADVQRRHGRDAVAVYSGNPTAHSPGALFFGQMLADALGTRSRFSTVSLDGLPRQLASFELYGNQALAPVPDLDRTEYLLVLGANPAVSNGSAMASPDVVRRLKDLRARGGRLVVIDPRRTETAKLADEHHFMRPGTDALLLAALLHVLFAEGLVRPGLLAPRLEGLGEVRDLVAPFSPERAAPHTGIDAATIARLARDFAAAPRAACYGRLGTCAQEFGGLASWLIDVANLATGNLDREGGAMFATPAVDLPAVARWVGLAGGFGRWRTRVRGLPEFGGELPVAALAEEIETPGPGRIRALVVHAGNPVLSLPNGGRVERALGSLELMVAIDVYRNETTRLADLILPPTFGLERDHYPLMGHAVAIRNTAHYARALLVSPPGSRHDWEILLGLAERVERARGGVAAVKGWLRGAVGRALPPRRLLALLLRLGPHHLSLARLERAPHGLDLGPLEPRLGRVLGRRRIRVVPERMRADWPRLEAKLAAPPPQAAARLVLIGRRALRSNNSWMHNCARLVSGTQGCVAQIHPDDGARLGVIAGERVALRSRTGEIRVPAEVTDDVMPGVVSVPHGWGHGRPGTAITTASAHPGASINDLTDDGLVDALSGTASLGGVPVEIEAAERRGAGAPAGATARR